MKSTLCPVGGHCPPHLCPLTKQALFFLCGDSDLHVPKASVQRWLASLRELEATSEVAAANEGARGNKGARGHSPREYCELPSAGSHEIGPRLG